MYEHMRIDFIEKLSGSFSKNEIDRIVSKLDEVAKKYTVGSSETSIVTYDSTQIPSLVNTYLITKAQEGYSKTTLKSVRYILAKFFNAVCKDVGQVNTNDIRAFLLQYQIEKDLKSNSMEIYRSKIAGFFKWCFEECYIDSNPSARVLKVKGEKRQRKAVTNYEIELMGDVCENNRDRAIIEFLLSTGCRVSELTNARVSDVDFERNTVTLFGKGRKERTVYISERTKILLKKYLAERTDNIDILFLRNKAPYVNLTKDGVEFIIRTVAKKAGINHKVSPHMFRHSMATRMITSGAKIEEVQRILGHSNISTTMIYAHVDDVQAREAHRRAIA